MRKFTATLSATAFLSLFVQFIGTVPANAIDAELADKCRRLMIKAIRTNRLARKKERLRPKENIFRIALKIMA